MHEAKCFRAAALAALVGFTAHVHAEGAPSPFFNVVQRDETSVVLNLANVPNWDERGATSNTIYDLFVGAGARVFSLQWALSLTGYPGTYLSEMQLTFSDTLGNGVTFTPGGGDEFDGTTNYAGFQDLRPEGHDFSLGADGILRLEFHDAYKDLGFDEPEGIWNNGTLRFGVSAVPEPESYALAVCGLIAIGAMAKRCSKVTTQPCVPVEPVCSTHCAV
jgi:hypothetical protein